MNVVKERRPKTDNAKLGVSGGMPFSVTSPIEIFHVRSTDISVSPNKSVNCYTESPLWPVLSSRCILNMKRLLIQKNDPLKISIKKRTEFHKKDTGTK